MGAIAAGRVDGPFGRELVDARGELNNGVEPRAGQRFFQLGGGGDAQRIA
jgi:hypothetical protein